MHYGDPFRFLAPRSRKPRQARKGAAVVMDAGAEGQLVRIASLLLKTRIFGDRRILSGLPPPLLDLSRSADYVSCPRLPGGSRGLSRPK